MGDVFLRYLKSTFYTLAGKDQATFLLLYAHSLIKMHSSK